MLPLALSLLIGVPHPLDLGLDAKLSDNFTAGLQGGYFALSVPQGTSTVKGSALNYELHARWHPFSGAFFLGGAFGRQTLGGSGTDTVDVGGGTMVPIQVTVSVPSTFAAPHLGWFWNFKSGFGLGFELGWLFPFGVSTSSTVEVTDSSMASQLPAVLTTAAYTRLQNDVNTLGDKYGSKSLPYTAIRFSWTF